MLEEELKSGSVSAKEKSQLEIENENFEELCKKKAEQLSAEEGKEITYHIWLERDKDGKQTGKRYVAYTRPPHIMVMVKAMDLLIQNRFHEAGYAVFPSCFISEASDHIIEENDSYKVALCGRLGVNIKTEAPELKKS